MKLFIAILLATLLGWQIGSSITSARDIAKGERMGCRGKVGML